MTTHDDPATAASVACPCGQPIPEQVAWYQAKVFRQARRLRRLEAIQSASKLHRLATLYVDARAAAAWHAQWARRESAYMKGYNQGFMDRHHTYLDPAVIDAGLPTDAQAEARPMHDGDPS